MRPASLAAGTAAMCLVVVTMEITTRVDDWAQFGVPLSSPETSLADLFTVDSLGAHAKPGTQFKQFKINGLGFRGREVSPSEMKGTAVVVSGASESFGLYETAGRDWPSQLADSLAATCGAQIPVLNAAFAGMSLPTVIQDVRLRIAPLRPRVGVYYPTPMQYLEGDALPRAMAPHSGAPRPPQQRLRFVPRLRDALKRSTPEVALDLARRILTARTRSSAGISASDRAEPERLAAFESDLRRLVGAYRQAGIEPMLAVHQNRFRESDSETSRRLLTAWERFYPRYTARAILSFDSLGGDATRRVAQDSAVHLLDPGPALARWDSDRVFADFTHFSDQGAAVVAGEAARILKPEVCTGGNASALTVRRTRLSIKVSPLNHSPPNAL